MSPEGWMLRVCRKVNLNTTGYIMYSFELIICGNKVLFLKNYMGTVVILFPA